MSSTAGLPVQTTLTMVAARVHRARAALEAALLAEGPQLPLWAPVMLGAGICCYLLLPWSGQRVGALIGMAGVAVLGLALRDVIARTLLLAALLMLLGFGVAWLRTQAVAAPRLAGQGIFQLVGTVTAVELRAGRGQIRLRIAPFDPALPPDVRVTASDTANVSNIPTSLRPGARVSMTTRLSPPPGPAMPDGYDFSRHAWFEGFGATGTSLGAVTLLDPAPTPTGFAARLEALRTALTARLKEKVPGVAGTFAAAFVTGDQGGIPGDVAQAMRDSGLAHLLSISGLHIAIVVAGTLWSIRKLLLFWPWLALRLPVKTIAASCAALAGIAYTLLAGSDVPTVRACLATLIVLGGIIIGREALSLRLVATAAFLILLVRPEALLGPSFQLSFAAVTGLIALYQSRAGIWLNTTGTYDGWAIRTARLALALVVTGLVAEAMLSATALYHFNRTGTYGVIANLLAIPLTSFVIMPLQVLALAMDTVGAGGPAYWLLGHAYSALISWAVEVAGWPGSVVRMPTMPMAAYALLVGGGLWLCLWQGRLRLWAVLPVTLGITMVLLARPPDILISADGRHVALRTAANGLAQLRARHTSFVTKSWMASSAADTTLPLSSLPDARCTRLSCTIALGAANQNRGGKLTTVLVIRTDDLPPRPALEPACRAADIVVSAVSLPGYCQPRTSRIDRDSLAQTQAMALWLTPFKTRSVAAQIGDHPWLPVEPLP